MLTYFFLILEVINFAIIFYFLAEIPVKQKPQLTQVIHKNPNCFYKNLSYSLKNCLVIQ